MTVEAGGNAYSDHWALKGYGDFFHIRTKKTGNCKTERYVLSE
jgi:hypothetical protein